MESLSLPFADAWRPASAIEVNWPPRHYDFHFTPHERFKIGSDSVQNTERKNSFLQRSLKSSWEHFEIFILWSIRRHKKGCFYLSFFFFPHWNVSAQFNLRSKCPTWKIIYLLSGIYIPYIPCVAFFFFICRSNYIFHILTVVSKRKSLKIVVVEVLLTLFYEMFSLKANVSQSARIVKLPLYTT